MYAQIYNYNMLSLLYEYGLGPTTLYRIISKDAVCKMRSFPCSSIPLKATDLMTLSLSAFPTSLAQCPQQFLNS